MASKGTSIFQFRTFCVVTGASQGFGRCLAETYAPRFPEGSVIVLMARNKDNLDEVKLAIESKTPSMKVKVVPINLRDQDGESLTNKLNGVFDDLAVKPQDFEHGLIFHNAGSLGDVSKKLTEIDNAKEVRQYWDLNMTSVVVLNAVFLGLFANAKHRSVVNVTSICALQPFKTWSLYCAGKAARDMLFRTMALEDPSIRVLNYAPGPINTEMQYEARTITGDQELKAMFSDMHEGGKLLPCIVSVDKLGKLLECNNFESGDHIDYYDNV